MEVTKKDVEKLIELRKENTFLHHLWNAFSRDMRPKGEVKLNEIKVWRQNMWNMIFYPIFTFELDANKHLTNITDELNPVGKTLIGIIIIGLISLIFPKNLSEFDLADNWQMATFLATFAFLTSWVARKFYRFEKQNQLEQIFKILDVEIEEKILEKEFSLKKILIRMFLYPFSLFVIFISIWSLFENGNIFATIMGVGVCGTYLFVDIKMIIQDRKTTGNIGK
ncbi:MAG: hypothetical protein WDZ45_03295 [Flavobacteriaceae bacterium]